jgi:hypothetical protein
MALAWDTRSPWTRAGATSLATTGGRLQPADVWTPAEAGGAYGVRMRKLDLVAVWAVAEKAVKSDFRVFVDQLPMFDLRGDVGVSATLAETNEAIFEALIPDTDSSDSGV